MSFFYHLSFLFEEFKPIFQSAQNYAYKSIMMMKEDVDVGGDFSLLVIRYTVHTKKILSISFFKLVKEILFS
jgi:hypothetical protein